MESRRENSSASRAQPASISGRYQEKKTLRVSNSLRRPLSPILENKNAQVTNDPTLVDPDNGIVFLDNVRNPY